MSRAPTAAPSPNRSHLRLVESPAPRARVFNPAHRGHLPHARRPGSVAFDAVAILATLYVAVVLLHFLPW